MQVIESVMHSDEAELRCSFASIILKARTEYKTINN